MKAAHDKLKAVGEFLLLSIRVPNVLQHVEGIWKSLECSICFETAWEPMVYVPSLVIHCEISATYRPFGRSA